MRVLRVQCCPSRSRPRAYPGFLSVGVAVGPIRGTSGPGGYLAHSIRCPLRWMCPGYALGVTSAGPTAKGRAPPRDGPIRTTAADHRRPSTPDRERNRRGVPSPSICAITTQRKHDHLRRRQSICVAIGDLSTTTRGHDQWIVTPRIKMSS